MRGVGQLKRLANQLAPKAIILLYHRVAELGSDPQLLCVTPQHFAEHLEVLARDYHPFSLDSLRRRQALNLWRPRSVVVTFDDGYADNLHHARPLLAKFGVPGTVFVVAGQVGETREFWWDDLARILLETPSLPEQLELTIATRAYTWHLTPSVGSETNAGSNCQGWHVLMKTDPNPRHVAYREIASLLRPLDGESREHLLVQMAAWAGLGWAGRPEYRQLDVAGLQELVYPGLVSVGAHTMTHPVLSALSTEMQQMEISSSKRRLEEILGQSVISFSYPFGGAGDYTAETIRLVEESGFACACSNFPGLIRPFADPFQLPRFLVRDWDGDEFANRLQRWFAA
jgi:peptidoglycan/xylan/chitin deacetylase (PgdA/CDA1 family)